MDNTTKQAIISRIESTALNTMTLRRAHDNPDRVSIAYIPDGELTYKVNITLDYIGIYTLVFEKVNLKGVV